MRMDRETSRYRNLNQALAWGFVGLQLLQLFVMPLWLLPLDPAWGWLLLLPVLLTNTWWALIHEAIHGGLTGNKAANRAWGRTHGVLLGASFDVLRWGHLLHHALSRSKRERSEVYVPGRDNRLAFTLDYFFHLLGGLYLVEVMGSLVFLLPRPWIMALSKRLSSDRNMVAALADKLMEPATLRAVRLDSGLILLIFGLSAYVYGPHVWMLVLAVAARAFLISFMDNVFHYATPLDGTRFARNLSLPVWAERLLLNFTLHGAHHLRPALAWWQLPAYHCSQASGYQGELIPALLDQLHGPIAEDRLTHHPMRGDAP